MMTMTPTEVATEIADAFARAATSADQLNQLDASLGDGDLGSTVAQCATALRQLRGVEYATVAAALSAASAKLVGVSGSSFATVFAVGLAGAAAAASDRTSLGLSDIRTLLHAATAEILSLGQVRPGDKTMVDGLIAIEHGLVDAGTRDAAMLLEDVRRSLSSELDRLRNERFLTGRGRVYGDRARGIDDPGMVALSNALGGSLGLS